ncbi:MAG: hypothetical protein PHQ27_04090 [Victivallales bacterium]|nr:hypothetical protein [Victivallales bacterium]
MHRLTTFVLLLVFCVTIKAEKFEKVGMIDIREFSKLTPRLTQLLQSVDPKKKSFPVIASAAIMFNPEMRGFDFKDSRTQIFYFIPKGRQCNSLDWCILVNRESGYPLPEQVTVMGKTAYTRPIDTRALISNSVELLNSIDRAPSAPDTYADVALQFQTAAISRQVKGGTTELLLWLKTLLTNGDVTATDTAQFTRHNAGIEAILAQVTTLSATINVRHDRMVINMEMVPESKSHLAEFIKLQSASENRLPGLVSTKNISATFNITPFEPAREALAHFLTNIESGLTQPEQKDYLRLMQSMATNSNGQVTYFMKKAEDGRTTAFARFYFDRDRDAANVNQTMKSIPRYVAGKDGLVQIYSIPKSRYTLFGNVHGKYFDFVAGQLTSDSAMKLLKSVPANIPDLSRYGMFYGNVNFNNRQYLSVQLGCTGKKVSCRLTLFAAILRKFLPENIEND